MRRITLALFIACLGACTSNPTPHPAQDAVNGRDESGNGTASDTSPAPSDYGPDEDNDGVADCLELNGAWDGEQCNTASATPDATGDATDATSEVSDAAADGSEPSDL